MEYDHVIILLKGLEIVYMTLYQVIKIIQIYTYILKKSIVGIQQNVNDNLWVAELLVILICFLQFFMFRNFFSDHILLL